MSDSYSSDSSEDEEEVLNRFEEEAREIIKVDSLPKKSSERYHLVYTTYKKWKEENKNSLSASEESNLLVYFNQLKQKMKPTTLWSIWSMLKKTLGAIDGIDLNRFLNLKSIIKNNAKGYKPKKSSVLRWEQILQFLNEAPDLNYLVTKVILIFGICGALRCDEITNMSIKDVEDLGDKFLISIHCNKNDYPGQFIIGNLFYDKIKLYISLRPNEIFHDRFFIQYQKGKCNRQPIGRHKIGDIPESIAKFLNLDNPKKYSGHCFRRTSATLLSESGANMQMIKQLGRWRSDIIAQGYIENSLKNRQLIYEGIIQKSSEMNLIEPRPSTSTQNNVEQGTAETENYNIDWCDFSEELTIDNLDSRNKKNNLPNSEDFVQVPQFSTASNKKLIITKSVNKSKNKHFLLKSPIKINYATPSAVQSSSNVKRKIIEENKETERENYDFNGLLNKNMKFENCTFNNCVFNITLCNNDHKNS